VLVGTGPVPNQAPTAKYTVACNQLVCSFDASGSADADGTISSYSWSFGDGQSSATGPAVSHTYSQAGTYTVALTVTDNAGAQGAVSSQVAVSAGPAPALAFRAVATFDGNVMKPTVVVPAQVTAGDQLLLFVSTNRNATAATPAGWTLRGTVADGIDVRSWVFSRAAVAGSAGSSVQVGLDAFSKTNLTLLAYAGAGQPGAPVGAAEPGTTALHKAPAATVAAAGSTVVSYWADKPSAAHGWTLPAGLTARSRTVGSGSGLLTAASGDSADVPAGTWPGATADAGTASAKAIAWTVVLPPL
jgi:PKD repeat protein